jgi:hypothetical protein
VLKIDWKKDGEGGGGKGMTGRSREIMRARN